jgi:hypothetical protein
MFMADWFRVAFHSPLGSHVPLPFGQPREASLPSHLELVFSGELTFTDSRERSTCAPLRPITEMVVVHLKQVRRLQVIEFWVLVLIFAGKVGELRRQLPGRTASRGRPEESPGPETCSRSDARPPGANSTSSKRPIPTTSLPATSQSLK